MEKEEVPAKTPRVEDLLCFGVYLAGHAFNRLYRSVLADLGLTYPQYLVMLVLWEQDGVPLKTVGERLMLDSGTLTPLLKRLEAAGLVRRARSRQDERQVLLHLTSAGAALRERGRCVPDAVGAAIGGQAGDHVALAARLAALRDALLAASDRQVK